MFEHMNICKCPVLYCRPPKVNSRSRLDHVLQEKDENGMDESFYKVRQLQKEVVKQLEVRQ